MTSRVEKSIEVNVPMQRADNQWTQFEQFPQFMGSSSSTTRAAGERPARAAGAVAAEGGTATSGVEQPGSAAPGCDRGWNGRHDDRLPGHAGRRCRCPGQRPAIQAAEADDLTRRARPAPLVRHEVRRVHVPHKLR